MLCRLALAAWGLVGTIAPVLARASIVLLASPCWRVSRPYSLWLDAREKEAGREGGRERQRDRHGKNVCIYVRLRACVCVYI